MPIVNNLTTNFSWPLPNQANFLSDDVARLVTTIQNIDTTLYAIYVTHNNTPVTLASASTVNIGGAASDNVIISGTTTITAFDNVNNGVKRWVRFAGVLTLTHNATSLILPGAANISTAANDTAEFISLGGGNWQCIRYTKAAVAPYTGTIPPGSATLASASTVNIGATTSDNVIITGTTTITAFDSVSSGIHKWVTFSGALTLTHNATSLILPGAANITTAANDTAEFISLGSGNWQCIRYTKASTAPGGGSGGVSWTKKTSAYTAVDKDGVMADTSGGAWTLKLPAAPTAGMQVYVVDNAGTWATNNLTVDPQGATIASQAASATLVMDVKGAYVAFVHDGTNWDVYSLANSVPVIPSGVLKGSGGAIAAAVAGTDYVTPTGSETLTNKTLIEYTETVYTLATSGSINLDPTNGSVQSCAAAGIITFVDALSSGQSIVLMLANGSSYSITWPTVTWVSSSGNVAPTLSAGNTVVFWKVGGTLYAAHVGKYA